MIRVILAAACMLAGCIAEGEPLRPPDTAVSSSEAPVTVAISANASRSLTPEMEIPLSGGGRSLIFRAHGAPEIDIECRLEGATRDDYVGLLIFERFEDQYHWSIGSFATGEGDTHIGGLPDGLLGVAVAWTAARASMLCTAEADGATPTIEPLAVGSAEVSAFHARPGTDPTQLDVQAVNVDVSTDVDLGELAAWVGEVRVAAEHPTSGETLSFGYYSGLALAQAASVDLDCERHGNAFSETQPMSPLTRGNYVGVGTGEGPSRVAATIRGASVLPTQDLILITVPFDSAALGSTIAPLDQRPLLPVEVSFG